jgi:hypothetical protein
MPQSQCRTYHTFHMVYYFLEYALIDDYLARRAAFREAHLTSPGKRIAVET